MPISGYVAAGAQEQLDKVLQRRLEEHQRRLEEARQAQELQFRRETIDLQKRGLDEASAARMAEQKYRQQEREAKIGEGVAEQVGFGDITPEQGALIGKSPVQAARLRKFDRPIIDARPIAGTAPLDTSGPQSLPVIRLEPTAAQAKQQTVEDERRRILSHLPGASQTRRRELEGEAAAAGVQGLPSNIFDETPEEKSAREMAKLAEQRSYSEGRDLINFNRAQGAINQRQNEAENKPTVYVHKGDQQRLVSPTQAAQMINSEGWKQGAPNKETGRPLSGTQVERLSGFASSLNLMKSLDFKTGETGFTAGMAAQTPDIITAAFGVGTEAKKRDALIKGVKQVVAKGLEGGVLRKEDEEKYKQIFPTMYDPQDLVLAKKQMLIAMLKSDRAARLQEMADAGFDVTDQQRRMRIQELIEAQEQ